MSEVKVNIRDNGPLLVEGTFKLVDATGAEVPLPANKPAIALCRCGHSANKPFCDGAHKAAGFDSSVRAPSS
jgi:CDGSH iron-sulfur domain-containing protein 3